MPEKLRLIRKLTSKQFTNIISKSKGIVEPLKSEGKSLTFTSVKKPKKAPFYIELEVPTINKIEGLKGGPDMFRPFSWSARYKAEPSFRPNVYDSSVKVFRKKMDGTYELIPKENLDSPDLLDFYGLSRKPIYSEKPYKLDIHTIYLPEPPSSGNTGSTIYLDEFVPHFPIFQAPQEILKNPNQIEVRTGNRSPQRYSDFPEFKIRGNVPEIIGDDGKFIQFGGDKTGEHVLKLKSKIANQFDISNSAKALISSAKAFYSSKYGIHPDALTNEEWGRLIQTLLETNSDKEILFHSTYAEPFTSVRPEELNKRNIGYLGRGFYASDAPDDSYGRLILPFVMPKGKQTVLTKNSYGFIHSDIKTLDKILKELRKPMVRRNNSTGKFEPDSWGPYPGMNETSKSPEIWNKAIEDLDLDLIKYTGSSMGFGVKYPEIVVPPNKVHLLEPLFTLKNGGIINRFKSKLHK